MATIWKFKTDENIDTLSRTVIKSEDVAATTKDTEFKLEDKLNQLKSLKEQKANIQLQIDELKAELLAIKEALNVIIPEV